MFRAFVVESAVCNAEVKIDLVFNVQILGPPEKCARAECE